MAYCEVLFQNSLSLLETLRWLIDVNLDIVYILTNFFIKKKSHFFAIFMFDN